MPRRADKAAVRACQHLSRTLQLCALGAKRRTKLPSATPALLRAAVPQGPKTLLTTFQLQLKTSPLGRAAELFKDPAPPQENLKKNKIKGNHPRNLKAALLVLLQAGFPPPY